VPVVGSVVSGPSGSAQDAPVGDVGCACTLLQVAEVVDGLGVGCPHPETFAFHLEGSQDSAP
jgi:hypothetical protein